MGKKRLLIIASTYPRWPNDSIPVFVADLAERLTATFDIHVLAPHFRGSKFNEFTNNVSIHRFVYAPPSLELLTYGGGVVNNLRKQPALFLLLPLYLLSQFLYLIALLFRYRFSIVHVHWVIPGGFLAAILKSIFSFKLVLTSHGGDIYGLSKSRLAKLLMLPRATNWTLKQADRITVVSSAIRDCLKTQFASAKFSREIVVIPMGVDFQAFSNPVRSYELNQSSILYVGRLAEKKGVKFLIEALATLKSQGKSFHCTIAGDGVEKLNLHELTANLGLKEYVTFTGHISRSELPKLFASHDIFVGPSIEAKGGDKEGLPVTFIEAMASGLPVIVTDSPGVTDLVTDQSSGIIVPQEDANAIANALEELLGDPAKREVIGTKAVAIAKNFDWDTISASFADILQR